MVAVGVGLTAVMALLGISGVQVLQESKSRLLEERLITARALAERLDDALLTSVQHLAGLAATPDLRELAGRPDDGAGWDEVASRVPFASYGLYLLDTRGIVVQGGRRLRGDRTMSLAQHDAVRQVLGGTRMAISGLLASPRTRTPIVLICVAVDPGALCAASDLSRLPFDRYISGVLLGQTGHAVIVDAHGRALASTDPDDRFGADEHPDFHTGLITRREAGVGPTAYYKGGMPVALHIMAFAPSRVASWGVSFGQTEAETLAPVTQTRTRMLVFGVVALLVALGFAWWDTGTVIQPLRRLVEQTRRIASGDLGGAVPVERGDELGELAASFEVMRDRLRALLEDLTHRESEAQALYEVSREVLSRPDLHGVLQSITEHARRLLGADVAVLCLAGERWQGTPVAASGPAEAVVLGATPTAFCARRDGTLEPRIPAGGCPVLHPAYRGTHAVAPLTLDGEVQGALCIGTRQATVFDGRATGLLASLANLAAIALRSADLHEQLHHLAVLEERERIGRDLHDSALQSLYGIALTLEAARASLATDSRATATRITQSLSAMSRLADEIRGYVRGLHAQRIADRPLPEALATLIDEINAAGTVPVSLTVGDHTSDLLEADRAQLILIVREALANVVRHSHASRAEVRLDADTGSLRVSVRDDGCGFDPDAPRAGGEGLGNMAARAQRIGGRLTIGSAAGRGTLAEVVVPRKDEGGERHGERARAVADRRRS